MAFTYTPGTPTDITRVRYHIGDTDEQIAIFTDEEIQFILNEQSSVGAAVVSLINSIIARLSATPDFTADWLRVDAGRSLDGYRMLLAEKRREFGLNQISSRARHTYRGDSLASGPPEW